MGKRRGNGVKSLVAAVVLAAVAGGGFLAYNTQHHPPAPVAPMAQQERAQQGINLSMAEVDVSADSRGDSVIAKRYA
jgi:hypothetical protein